MTRQPKLVLRESAINDVSRLWEPGSFLETGSGTGYMTKIFLDKNYAGTCFEISDVARSIGKNRLENYKDKIDFVESLEYIKEEKYDYLLSFEVLEHIEDDLTALKDWSSFLKEGGRLLLSVPAHQRKYGLGDKIVGHVRRYERKELFEKLEAAGYENIEIINYGYPVTEITRVISNYLLNMKESKNFKNDESASLKSSYSRPGYIQQLIDAFGEKWIYPFCFIQRMFYRFDLGDGIVATATLKY